MKVAALMPGCEVAEVPPEQGRSGRASGTAGDVQ